MRSPQEQIQKFFLKLKTSFADYRITLIGILLLTIYGTISSMIPYEYEISIFMYENVVSEVLMLFCTASVLVETCFSENRTAKLFGLLGAAFAAGFLTFCFGLDETVEIAGISGAFLSRMASRFMAGYVPLLLAATVYFCFKKTGMQFEKYALRVFSNLFKTFIVYVILTIGVTIVFGIFSVLFLEGSGFYLDSAGYILVMGGYLIPNCIAALNDMRSEPGSFSFMIVKYVLTGLTICAAVIVYLYIMKILILWEMPSNEIFSILSALFVCGMPIWLMAGGCQDENFYSRLISIMPYIFAPLICLQVYSMGVRIGQYGMTTNRYLGMMLIIFEIGTLFIWHFSKGKREKMIPFFCLLAAISVFAPGVNMYSLSNSWQSFYLKKYYQAAMADQELSDLEYERLAGAWKYLSKQEETKDKAAEYDISSIEQVEKMAEQHGDEIGLTQYDTHYVHCCQMVGELDIGRYQRMSMLNQDDCYDETGGNGIEVDFSNFRFVERGTGETLSVDLQDFAQRCIDYEKEHPNAYKEEMSDAAKPYNRIFLEDGRELVMNHFQVTYQEGIKDGKEYFSWQTLEVGAILFEKK